MLADINYIINDIDEKRIPTIYTQADSSLSRRLVVMCHGISTDKDEYLLFYRALSIKLAAHGIDTLRLDFRGHGDSEYTPDKFTIESQVTDLLSVLSWAKDKYAAPDISLLGTSFGAPPCIFVDSLSNLTLGKRFLIAPVLDYRRIFLEPESAWGKETFTSDALHAAMHGNRLYLSDNFYVTGKLFVEMSLINIPSIIEHSNANLVIMHGEEDDMVPHFISVDTSSRYDNIVLHSFADMEHGFTHKGDEEGNAKKTINNIDKMINIICEGIGES